MEVGLPRTLWVAICIFLVDSLLALLSDDADGHVDIRIVPVA